MTMQRRSHIHNPLLWPRDCVSCPSQLPTCSCPSDQDCSINFRTCDACDTIVCTPRSGASSGTSKGAMAGAIVGILVFLSLVVGGFLWWRRRSHLRRVLAANREKGVENTANIPGQSAPLAGAGTPSPLASQTFRGIPTDAVEKSTTDGRSIHDPSNPFADQTRDSLRSGQSIPIGFMSEGALTPSAVSPTGTTFTGPVRPQRSPELSILNNPNFLDRPMSQLQPPRPGYAPSQRSQFTVSSVGSAASSAMLYESPTIVTAGSRQVFGAGRAEVIQVNGLQSAGPSSRATSVSNAHRSHTSSGPGPSPLASSQFTGSFPTIEEDPFGDSAESYIRPGSIGSNMTFGTPLASTHLSHNGRSLMMSGMPTYSDGGVVGDLNHPLASGSSISLQGQGKAGTTDSNKESTYDLYFDPPRRSSQESVASNTFSVLAGFPFVPPSPLPPSNPRSPLSVVFNPNRQSTASSTATSSRPSSPAPPLPNINTSHRAPPSSLSRVAMSADDHQITPPSPNNVAYPPDEDDDVTARLPRQSVAASTMSRASASSSGLDAFQFHFAGGDDHEPLPPLNPAFFGHGNSDSVSSVATAGKKATPPAPAAPATTMAATPTPEKNSGEAQQSDGPAGRQQQDRASLDTLALSRSLAATQLPYE